MEKPTERRGAGKRRLLVDLDEQRVDFVGGSEELEPLDIDAFIEPQSAPLPADFRDSYAVESVPMGGASGIAA